MAHTHSAGESGILFLKSSLRDPDFDFTTLYDKLEKVTRHEEYQDVPHTSTYTVTDWTGQQDTVRGRTHYKSELCTVSLSLDNLVSPDLRKIIEAIVKQAETAKLFDKFRDLKSKVDPDVPKTLKTYQDFLNEAEYKDVKLDDLKKFKPLSRDETVRQVGHEIVAEKTDTIPDMISGIVLLKDAKEFFGIDVVDAATVKKMKVLLKDAIVAALKDDAKPPSKLEDGLGKLFATAKKQIHELDQLRSNMQGHGLSVDNDEIEQKVSEIVRTQTDIIYNRLAEGWHASP